MKRPFESSIFIIFILVSCCGIFSGCIKNRSVTTINPSMTANIGSYNFTALTVEPSTIDTQAHDSITTLVITGNTADMTSPHDKIELKISKYKIRTGTFSIVENQAFAFYVHSGVYSYALGGIVAITQVTPTSLIGYFSFTTQDGLVVANGAFNVLRPY